MNSYVLFLNVLSFLKVFGRVTACGHVSIQNVPSFLMVFGRVNECDHENDCGSSKPRALGGVHSCVDSNQPLFHEIIAKDLYGFSLSYLNHANPIIARDDYGFLYGGYDAQQSLLLFYGRLEDGF